MEHKSHRGCACDIISTLFRMFLHTSIYALPFCVAVSSEIKWQLYKDIILYYLRSGNFCCKNIFMVLHKP